MDSAAYLKSIGGVWQRLPLTESMEQQDAEA
jgi:hypothetical protein